MEMNVTPPESGLGTNAARWKGKERQAAEPDNSEPFLSRVNQFCDLCDDFVATDGTRCVDSGHIPTFDDVSTEDEKPPTMSSWTTDADTDDDLTFKSAEDTQASSVCSTDVEMCDVPVEEPFFSLTEQAPAQSPYELPVRSNELKTCILTEEQVITIFRESANVKAFVENLKLRLISSPALESAEATPRPAVDLESVEGPSCRLSDAYRFGPDERARAHANLIKYVETRNSNPCETHRKPRSASPELYECPFNCGFSARRGDYLFKHLLLTFPQQFWYCSLCEDLPIYHQHDKFQDHLKAFHKSVITKGDICERDMSHRNLCRNSELTYVAPFPTTCPFAVQNIFCQTRFRSWKEFKEHLLQHFREKIDGPWRLRYWPRGPPRDDDDGQDHWGTSTSNYTLSHHAIKSGSSEPGSSKPRNRVYSNQGWARYRSERLETTEALNAAVVQNRTLSWILDVEAQNMTTLLRLVDIRTKSLTDVLERPPYLALTVVHLGKQPLGSSMHALEQLLRIYSTAIQITGDMGYQFLWIDGFCENPVTNSLRKQRQREASLVLIMSGTETMSGELWHCLCPPKDLETFLPSALDLPIAYRRKSGHGTYRITNEVLHKTSNFRFAHKQLLHCKQQYLSAEQWPYNKRTLLIFDNVDTPESMWACTGQNSMSILTFSVTGRSSRHFRVRSGRSNDFLLQSQPSMRFMESTAESLHMWSICHGDQKPPKSLVSKNSLLLSDLEIASFEPEDRMIKKTRSFTPRHGSQESQGCILDTGVNPLTLVNVLLELARLISKVMACLNTMKLFSSSASCRKALALCHEMLLHFPEKHTTEEGFIKPRITLHDRMLYSMWQMSFKQFAKQSYPAGNLLRVLHMLDSLDGLCEMHLQWLSRVVDREPGVMTRHNLHLLEMFDRREWDTTLISTTTKLPPPRTIDRPTEKLSNKIKELEPLMRGYIDTTCPPSPLLGLVSTLLNWQHEPDYSSLYEATQAEWNFSVSIGGTGWGLTIWFDLNGADVFIPEDIIWVTYTPPNPPPNPLPGNEPPSTRYPLLIMNARRSLGRALLQTRGSLPDDAIDRWMLMTTDDQATARRRARALHL